MDSYLINLDKDRERLNFFAQRFYGLGLEFERIAAVDGRLMSAEERAHFAASRPRRGRPWAPGQIGCLLSHMEAWRRIEASGVDYAAVFEDDVHLADDLPQLLRSNSWIPAGADIIRLEPSTNRLRLLRNPVSQCNGRGVYSLKSTSWCTGGYIISRSLCQRLLALDPVHHDASDALLYNFKYSVIAQNSAIYQLSPAICMQDKFSAGDVIFESNIESVAADAWVKPRWEQRVKNLAARALGYYRVQYH